jgi:hypothetical protein
MQARIHSSYLFANGSMHLTNPLAKGGLGGRSVYFGSAQNGDIVQSSPYFKLLSSIKNLRSFKVHCPTPYMHFRFSLCFFGEFLQFYENIFAARSVCINGMMCKGSVSILLRNLRDLLLVQEIAAPRE